MKLKHIISIFVLGFIFTILGALFKIQHWMFAPELLTFGTVLKVVALILFIIKLFTNNKFKDLLNQ